MHTIFFFYFILIFLTLLSFVLYFTLFNYINIIFLNSLPKRNASSKCYEGSKNLGTVHIIISN